MRRRCEGRKQIRVTASYCVVELEFTVHRVRLEYRRSKAFLSYLERQDNVNKFCSTVVNRLCIGITNMRT